MGGQKTLRSYWRNYYEQTDALIWVVDTTDLHRLEDCRDELHNLLKEERLAGATLLIFANKQDLSGSLSLTQLQKVGQHQPINQLINQLPIRNVVWANSSSKRGECNPGKPSQDRHYHMAPQSPVTRVDCRSW